MSLRVLSGAGLATIQDLGRVGWERFGVPVCGAMDQFAIRAANYLVGNPPQAACVETALAQLTLLAEDDLIVAATGRGWRLRIDSREIPPWMAAVARGGERIELIPDGQPGWGYLAASGGVNVPLVMGSRSTYLRGGFGGLLGRILQRGDSLPIGSHAPFNRLQQRAGTSLSPDIIPPYANQVTVHLIPGPQLDAFSEAALPALLENEYTLTAACDRMGYRLAGTPLTHRHTADILSEGTPFGSVQVPGDGQPVVLMADRQATGGYAKIGVVASADLPLLAQCPADGGKVRFVITSPIEAAIRLRKMYNHFKNP